MNISGINIGPGYPCRFCVEVSNAHGGDFDRAIRLIDAAKATGADFCKFQAFQVSELLALRGDGPAPEPWGSAGWTMESLYRKAQTPLEWFPKLAQHCKDIEMPWFSSVFGVESLLTLEKCGCPTYKIASLDRKSHTLMRTILSTGKNIIVSTPDAHDPPHGSGPLRLYCPPGYPTKIEDIHLPVSLGWAGYAGLSSHCLDPVLPIAAVARGAKLLEYHMQLAEEPSELEASVSLTEHQFKDMIDNVRRVESMLA